MIKRDELSDLNSCLNRAKDDEEVFVLLGRDRATPTAIRAWVAERVLIDKNKLTDPEIVEALEMANRVEDAHGKEEKGSHAVDD